MAGRDYERLAIEPFGRHLINSGDLDPVYIALRDVDWAHSQRNRWLIAYWCFYHCGLASHASEHEGAKFWEILHAAAANENPAPAGGRWPRGHERRHARGKQGIGMVSDLARRYYDDPSQMINYITKRLTPDPAIPMAFALITDRVKEHTLFGPWIAFKVADMVERVLDIPVNFEQAHIFMFKDPVKAALMLWRQRMGLSPSYDGIIKPKDLNGVIAEVVNYLVNEFKDLKAPPEGDRPIQLQEVETVLCKWKSHQNGHYPLYNDIDEINAGLVDWGEAAEQFAVAMPERGDA